MNRAAAALNAVRESVPSPDFHWGAEIVLTRDTLDELPRVVEWVGERGGAFLLVTHLLPYREESVTGVAYNPNVDETLAFYREKSEEAKAQGIDLSRYIEAKWRFRPVGNGEETVAFMEKVIAEISARGLPQHVPNLVAHDEKRHRRMEELFYRCEELASQHGVELRLPSLSPRNKRLCDFIEEGSAFVAASGTVHPLLLPVALLHMPCGRPRQTRRRALLRIGARNAASGDMERPGVFKLPQRDRTLRLPPLRQL